MARKTGRRVPACFTMRPSANHRAHDLHTSTDLVCRPETSEAGGGLLHQSHEHPRYRRFLSVCYRIPYDSGDSKMTLYLRSLQSQESTRVSDSIARDERNGRECRKSGLRHPVNLAQLRRSRCLPLTYHDHSTRVATFLR